MRVGFFLDNSKYKTTDFSNPMQGNPGVRGTQYMIWTIACFLNDAYKDIETIIFAPYVDKMPKNQKCEVFQNDIQALEKAKELNEIYDKFIVWNDQVCNPFNNSRDTTYLLDFVSDDRKKSHILRASVYRGSIIS